MDWAALKVLAPVTANVPLELMLFARLAATLVPRPLKPVATGKPVAFVSVIAEGVSRFGVMSDGDEASTTAPVPVSSDMTLAN
jgi:hypothetical protein